MTRGLSNPKVRSLRPGEKKIDSNRDSNRKTTFADFKLDLLIGKLLLQTFFQIFICSLFYSYLSALFSVAFEDSHHFGSLLSAEFFSSHLSAVFDHSLSRQPSLQQPFLESLKTAITSAVFDHCYLSAVQCCLQSLKTAITSAVFQDSHHFSNLFYSLGRQPSLQQSLMTELFSQEPFAVAFGNK